MLENKGSTSAEETDKLLLGKRGVSHDVGQ